MPEPALFLDTTIQVERSIHAENPGMAQGVKDLLASYQFLMACGFSRLEFKRVVIQNLALLLDYLTEDGEHSFFRAMMKVTKLRQDRRVKTLENILAWVGYQVRKTIEVQLGDDVDRRLALQAESHIRNAVRTLWIWFEKKIDKIADRMQCRRGTEGPELKRDGTLDVRIPESQCDNKECNNANFFRSRLPDLRKLAQTLRKLEDEGQTLSGELLKARNAIDAAEKNPDRLYNYKRCLEMGDVWIHLECLAAGVTDFATTNYKESQHLCPLLGLTMRQPSTRLETPSAFEESENRS